MPAASPASRDDALRIKRDPRSVESMSLVLADLLLAYNLQRCTLRCPLIVNELIGNLARQVDSRLFPSAKDHFFI